MPYTEDDFRRIGIDEHTQPRFWNQFIDAFKITPKISEVVTEDTLTVATGGVPAWLRTQGTVNVENHGVRTTNTATQNVGALNALFAAIDAGDIAERRVFLPNRYDIDASILVDQGRIELFGANRESSGLEQQTANLPILKWDNESDNVTQMTSIHVHDLALRHAAQASGSDTQQFGIRFRPSPSGASPGAWNGFGWYLNCFEDLEFRNSYKGIGVDPNATVIAALWSSEFRGLTFWDTKRNALYFNDGGVGGWPANTISGADVLNYGMRRGDGGGNYPTAPALDIVGNHGLVIDNLNIEDWVDNAVLITTSNGLSITGLRTERHDMRTNVTSVVHIGDCDGAVINAYSNQLMRLNQAGQAFLLNCAAASQLVVNGLTADRASGSGTDVTAAIWGDPATSRLILNGSSLAAVPNAGVAATIHETLTSAWGTGLYTVVSRDGLPPIWDARPTAAAGYRDRLSTVRGGAGVADTTAQCRKDAADAYGWVAI